MEENQAGYAILKKNDLVIYVNEKSGKNRQRFTIAHELGHYYLHYLPNPENFKEHYKRDSTYFRSQNYLQNDDPFEREADYFASKLLVPDELLERELLKRPNRMGELSDEEIMQLADVFKVNIQVISIRTASSF